CRRSATASSGRRWSWRPARARSTGPAGCRCGGVSTGGDAAPPPRYSYAMEFGLDDEQEMIVQTLRRFAERDLRGWAADADRAGAPPERLHALGAELGCFLDAVPAADGGLLEGTYSHTTRALRGFELGRGCAGLAALLETNVETALAVQAWGSAAARQ